MANIKITIDGALMDGHKVTFKAPCDCTEIEKLDVRYVQNGSQVSKIFTMKDANGNALDTLSNLFTAGAYVRVILDSANGFAYLQNPDTNGYLENKFKKIDGSKLLSTSILGEALMLKAPGTYEFQLNGSSYTGDDLPSANYAYGSATVHRRSESFADVVLHGCVNYENGEVLPMAKNYYNKNYGWSGWQVMGDMKGVPTIQLDAENKIAYITANVG